MLFIFIATLDGDFSSRPNEVTLLVPLASIPAWYFYFKISSSWLQYGSVSKKLKVRGILLGSLAVLLSMGAGLVYCFPSILLMVYIYFTAPEHKKADAQ
jgi:hypothetical protein